MDWYRYWNEAPAAVGERDFLRQVGKTVGGVPISPGQFARLVEQLRAGLAPRGSDRVLDLCCGNGVVTERIADCCREVVGLDCSGPLLEVARRHHQPGNVRYFAARLPDCAEAAFDGAARFDRIYMYEALQHFAESELAALLDRIRSWSAPGARVYLGSIPDRGRIGAFYDTPARRAERARRVAEGREAIGTWWDRGAIAGAAAGAGFACTVVDQHPDLHTAHYRFDLLLEAP